MHVITSYSIHYTKLYDGITRELRPALARLMGWQLPPPRWLPALTTAPLRLTPGRQDFQRGCLFVDESYNFV